MQMPIHPEPILNSLGENGNPDLHLPPRLVLSFESQMKLRGLYEFVDAGHCVTDEVRRNLSLDDLHKATEGLGKICIEADSWGFDDLYEVAQGLQILLLKCGDRIGSDALRELLDRGLTLLSALLGQCERDLYWRLAIADLLESLDHAAHH